MIFTIQLKATKISDAKKLFQLISRNRSGQRETTLKTFILYIYLKIV